MDCPWVVVTNQGTRIDSVESPDEADAALSNALSTRPEVLRVSETELGQLTFEFDNSAMLLVRPSSLPGEAWRIFAPGSKDSHLVFCDGEKRWE
jgi:hypothetical protein